VVFLWANKNNFALMSIEQIDIKKFSDLANEFPVFDVRSPAEFAHAHMPNATSLPLFTDDQRKIIGTAYKQESRQIAVNIGLEYFSERMKIIHDEVEANILSWKESQKDKQYNNVPILLHCWRGGMRSGAVAWLLNLYGHKIYTLQGGYKSFRNWALGQFEKEYKLKILGGFTGSGKTMLLLEMKAKGKSIIDLENLANHKGSAFGSLGEKAQPSQEMFENLLAVELQKANKTNVKNEIDNDFLSQKEVCEIWIEDESRHIGTAGIPQKFWEQMRKSPVYFLDISFGERLKNIVSTYGVFEKEKLISATARIAKRLGGLETKKTIDFFGGENLQEAFSILLHYYDKLYTKSLQNRENITTQLNKILCEIVDISNIQKLFEQKV
jgi:tRNA 2-selenouridine synthase